MEKQQKKNPVFSVMALFPAWNKPGFDCVKGWKTACWACEKHTFTYQIPLPKKVCMMSVIVTGGCMTGNWMGCFCWCKRRRICGRGGWRMTGRMTSSLNVSQKKSWWHDAVWDLRRSYSTFVYAVTAWDRWACEVRAACERWLEKRPNYDEFSCMFSLTYESFFSLHVFFCVPSPTAWTGP